MMLEYPKHIKRAIRELAGVAYEEEMKRELGQLAQGFDDWRAGKIDVWELHRRIHKYHDGPARALYNQYNESHQDMLVAYAIVRGVISQERVPRSSGNISSGRWPSTGPWSSAAGPARRPRKVATKTGNSACDRIEAAAPGTPVRCPRKRPGRKGVRWRASITL